MAWLGVPCGLLALTNFIVFPRASRFAPAWEAITLGAFYLIADLSVLAWLGLIVRARLSLEASSWRRNVAKTIGIVVYCGLAVFMGIGLFPSFAGLVWIALDSLRP
jgi:hypothetical protein